MIGQVSTSRSARGYVEHLIELAFSIRGLESRCFRFQTILHLESTVDGAGVCLAPVAPPSSRCCVSIHNPIKCLAGDFHSIPNEIYRTTALNAYFTILFMYMMSLKLCQPVLCLICGAHLQPLLRVVLLNLSSLVFCSLDAPEWQAPSLK